MDGVLGLLKFLYDAGAAVIPWLVATMAVWLTYRTWPHVIELIQARAQAQHDIAERENERNEILRHNNVVISNCTETMRMIKRYMEEQDYKHCSELAQHEQLSAERVERIQASLDSVLVDSRTTRGDIQVLLDRSNQRRRGDFS